MRQLLLFSLLVALTALGTGCGKKTPTDSSPTGDKKVEQLQGIWAIKKIEGRDTSKWSDDRKKADEEEMKNQRIVFDGDKLTIFAEGDEIRFAFKADDSKNPKQLLLTMLDDEGKPRVRPAGTKKGGGKTEPQEEKGVWIYKFEGDSLIIAMNRGDDETPPADFTAKASKFDDGKYEPGVTVLTLQRTDTPAPKNTQTKDKVTTRPSPATKPSGSTGKSPTTGKTPPTSKAK
jgi:uncharacterized protein (TIGR03067 family)